MQALRNIFRHIAASLMFFTRLPLWKWVKLERMDTSYIVPLWPLAGWLTGGVLSLVCCLALRLGLSLGMAVMLGWLSRLLLTGALHEDGLADVCDGFGAGGDRKRILSIMKDSHIGTYGVLGLIVYALLFQQVLTALLSKGVGSEVLLAGDVSAKFMASTIILFLPYARSESEAKTGVVYCRKHCAEWIVGIVAFLAALILLFLILPGILSVLLPLIISFLACAMMFFFMHSRIGGYTGDCCGATFLVAELVYYFTLLLTI